MRIIKKGATSQFLYFIALDSASTTGGRKTGIVYNAAGLTAYYVRSGGSATAITLVTLAAANSAYSSGGFKEVDSANMPGLYRIDVPDAAFASGVDSVVITVKGAAGMVQADIEVQLVAIDPQDTVRAGLTALPNVAAGSDGGVLLYNALTRAMMGIMNFGTLTSANSLGGVLDASLPTSVTVTDDMFLGCGIFVYSTATSGAFNVAEITDYVIATRAFAVDGWPNGTPTGAPLNYIIFATPKAASTFAAALRAAIGMSAANMDTQLGNIYGRQGAPAGASQSADVAAVFSRIGAPAGASIAADIATRLSTAGYTAPPSASTISTTVWTEAIPGAFGAGTAGAKLNAASSAGDPWATVIPGAYGANTAGNILGNRLDAAVSSRLATGAYVAPDNAGITSIFSRIGAPIGASISADIQTRSTFDPATAVVEGAITWVQSARGWNSGIMGKSSGLEGVSPIFRDMADTKNRIVASVDAFGNRTAIVRDLT